MRDDAGYLDLEGTRNVWRGTRMCHEWIAERCRLRGIPFDATASLRLDHALAEEESAMAAMLEHERAMQIALEGPDAADAWLYAASTAPTASEAPLWGPTQLIWE
jgi:hypothetical protein